MTDELYVCPFFKDICAKTLTFKFWLLVSSCWGEQSRNSIEVGMPKLGTLAACGYLKNIMQVSFLVMMYGMQVGDTTIHKKKVRPLIRGLFYRSIP